MVASLSSHLNWNFHGSIYLRTRFNIYFNISLSVEFLFAQHLMIIPNINSRLYYVIMRLLYQFSVCFTVGLGESPFWILQFLHVLLFLVYWRRTDVHLKWRRSIFTMFFSAFLYIFHNSYFRYLTVVILIQ